MSLISSVIQSTSNVDMNLNCLCQEEQNNRIDSQDSAEVSKKINTHKHRTQNKAYKNYHTYGIYCFFIKNKFPGFLCLLVFFFYENSHCKCNFYVLTK